MPVNHFKAEIMWPILVANKLLRRPFFSNSFVADFPAVADHLHNSKLHLPQQTESVKYRLFASTWNVGGIPPEQDLNLEEFLDTKNNIYDIYVTGFQEVVPLSAKSVLGWEKNKMVFGEWNSIIRRTLNGPRLGSFSCIVSKQMVGIMVSVWVKDDILPFIHHPSVSCVGCGVLGCLGNKGSVSVRFSFHETSLCIVCCHLASGAKEGDEMLRNSNALEIISRTIFPSGPSLHLPTKMNDHERVIMLGDLNYRISLPEEETRALVLQEEWGVLLEKDQLKVEMMKGGAFEGWHEGEINFLPTYKYYPNSDEYYGSHLGRNCLKKRAPAWCDRIIWHGRGLRQTGYDRCESKHSDHRPVRATFTVEFEVQNGFDVI